MSAATLEIEKPQIHNEQIPERHFSPERLHDATVLYNDARKLLDNAKSGDGKPARFVERPTASLPVKDGRPGIGYKGVPGYTLTDAFISLERAANETIIVRLTAPSDGTFGRPNAVAGDFGAAADENFELFHSFEVRLRPGEAPTRIYADPADEFSPDELDDLYGGDGRQPDAMLLARTCVDGLQAGPTNKTHAVQILGGGVLQHA